MDKYIGTMLFEAAPYWRHTGTDGRDHYVPMSDAISLLAGEKAEEGYMVDLGGSWIRKDEFEIFCRPLGSMSFGLALEAAKEGKRIARKGWNGKGMSVAYQKGYPDGIPCNKNTAEAWGMEEGELFKCNPYLQMRCADGSFQMWVASQADMLADDWYIID